MPKPIEAIDLDDGLTSAKIFGQCTVERGKDQPPKVQILLQIWKTQMRMVVWAPICLQTKEELRMIVGAHDVDSQAFLCPKRWSA